LAGGFNFASNSKKVMETARRRAEEILIGARARRLQCPALNVTRSRDISSH
jgi:hypothetical protein